MISVLQNLWIILYCHLIQNAIGFMDTSKWFGAEYTPSTASNSLWWYYYSNYTEEIDRELNFIENKLSFNSLRMFLHNMVFDAGSDQYIKYIDDFLNRTLSHNIKAGFVFFDDCWNMNGANISAPCQPTPGVHNGCWMTCPQQNQRDINNITQFKPYVTDIIQHFQHDKRILFWEIYNEPKQQSNFSITLRNTAYEWIKNINTTIPVISCWDNNNNTDISDMHRYDNNFVGWKKQIAFGDNGNKGTVITEGGARWYTGYADTGSPIEVINFMEAYRNNTDNKWYPGIFMNWEVMIGNTNTRWHWGSKAYSPEPNIPFDGYLFPDGTPVSYTEIYIIQRYITKQNKFIYLDTFLPNEDSLTKDYYLILDSIHLFTINQTLDNYLDDILLEYSFWPSSISDLWSWWNMQYSYGVIVSYAVEINMINSSLNLYRANQLQSVIWTLISTFNISKLDCGVTVNGWNTLRVRIKWEFINGAQEYDGNLITNVSIWLNPMYENASMPRMNYSDVVTGLENDLTVMVNEFYFEEKIYHATNNSKLDYISVLPGIVCDE
eukprot:394403_1